MRKMTIFLMALFMIVPLSSGNAYDQYNGVANPTWKLHQYVNEYVILKVDSKVKFSTGDLELVENTYNIAAKRFFKFQKVSDTQCDISELEVLIVPKKTLDSRKHFPSEKTYAEGTDIVYGRYFRSTNKLYILPPDLTKYYWKKHFTHELAHYFYDDCGIKFRSSDAEHKEINRFLRKSY